MCATNTEELILWNCIKDGSMASRSLSAGVGFKPPSAAAFKRRGGERLRKRRLIKCQVSAEKMSASEPLKTPRKSLKEAVKTEGDRFSQDKSEGNLFIVQTAVGVKKA